MPILEYECEECKKVFEIIELKQSDVRDIINCVECDAKNSAKKIMSNTSFRLMGEGWSETGHDYPTTTCNPNSNEKKTKARIKRKDFKH